MTTWPRFGTSCSASLWNSNLSGIFGQPKRKHLYDSDKRQPASPAVKEQVCDNKFVWCELSVLRDILCDILTCRNKNKTDILICCLLAWPAWSSANDYANTVKTSINEPKF